jgi:hypothetical protein
VTVHRDKLLQENQLNALISQTYSWNETLHVSYSFSVHHQEFFYCTHSNGICHTGLLTACEQDQAGTEFQDQAGTEFQDQAGTEFHSDPAPEINAFIWFYYRNISKEYFVLPAVKTNKTKKLQLE